MILPTDVVLLPVYVLPPVLSKIDIFKHNIMSSRRGQTKAWARSNYRGMQHILYFFFLPKILYNSVENNTSLKPLSDVSLRSGIATLFFPPPISCPEDCSELVTKVGGGNLSNNVSRIKKKMVGGLLVQFASSGFAFAEHLCQN
jgi:hypothetical protein